MRCGDPPPGRDGWRIEIGAIEKGDSNQERLQLRNVAIASSGDLFQYLQLGDQRLSHVLDPKRGAFRARVWPP